MLLGESSKKMRVGSVCRGTGNRREGGRLIARGDGGRHLFSSESGSSESGTGTFSRKGLGPFLENEPVPLRASR